MPTQSPAYAFDPASVALGEAIFRARKALGLSQEDLAHRAEIDRSHMGSIERGKQNPTLIVLVRIAYAMDVTLVDLIDLAGI
jgi:transcriptional regulator with XRE-family HTH domain